MNIKLVLNQEKFLENRTKLVKNRLIKQKMIFWSPISQNQFLIKILIFQGSIELIKIDIEKKKRESKVQNIFAYFSVTTRRIIS